MIDFLARLFDASGFPPRWQCGTWTPGLGWLHILSDLGVWSAYLAIPAVLVFFAVRRKQLPFRGVFVLFGAFILACGTTHLMEAIIFWWPGYRLAGAIKLATAVVSWATVFTLVRVTPRALAMRSPTDLEREIAGRKQIEATLRESEERFRGALEHAAIGMALVAPDGRWLRVNPALGRIVGYAEPELLTRTFQDITHPDDLAADLDEVRRMLAGEILTYQMEKRYIHKAGHTVWTLLSVSLVRDAAGVPLYFVSQVQDITGRKRFEQTLQEKNVELEKASRAKDHFLATMSHELRTPMNAILGFTGTLLMRLPGPLTADQEKQLRTVQASARHLLSLINDLLDLAKIESGKVELRPEPVECQALMHEITSALRPLAEAKGLTFETRAPPGEFVVHLDRRALTQILLNLTNNAIKFTERGTVCLEFFGPVEGGRKRTEFRVSDTGVGIRAEDQQKLFQAFTQMDTPSKRHEGSGLGLHLSRRLAELLGGSLSFRSEFGRGSTFVLAFAEESRPAAS
ncbi:MAG: pleC 2 [Gemmataceae bacterium]|nr:pleC 2 [Gemmataceae bacterium]